ncbi:hypothetical protein GIB67_017863 [Kingdonia uniflora]|uniref:Vacuolar protein sorting-associated protein 9A n=1 Tax=Kingdonia uniflora TaxID=39325 RepID=A0A7J7ML97_9MAGN|nr:hypothetical protein GIB67_017863 [Kingdonia uniflora]
MENADMFGSSTAPLTWHDFLERMRHPSASDFVKSIKSFIVSFSNNVPDPERDSAAVQEFLTKMEGAFKAHSLWAGSSEEELDSAGEGLEKYVMTKLFPRVFASNPEDVKCDEQLSDKMSLIQQFIRPENLDMKPPFQNETSWLLAQKELQKINMYKAPREKLVCILNCCKVINNLLLNASIASNESPPGADEFLPVLIFVTIKANPPQLHSNLLYIQRFRRQSRLVSEAAYFFTNMLSAASFISNIDANALSMEETEFEKNMESARTLLTGLANDLGVSNQSDGGSRHVQKREPAETKLQLNDPDSIMRKPSISDLENKGAAELLKDDQTSEAFQNYPYLYAQVGDLTVNDVEELLNGYKQLVLKYISLARGMNIGSSDPSSVALQSKAQVDSEIEKEPEDIASKENYEDVFRTEESIDGGSLLQQLENFQISMSQDDAPGLTHQDGEEDQVAP